MKLLYRADGGHPIGTGHIFRAARLIRALSSKCDLDATLLMSEDPGAIHIAEGCPATIDLLPPRINNGAVKPLLQADPVLRRLNADRYDLVVVDMLDTPGDDMARIAATGVPLVTFDDRGAGRFHADALINILVTEPTPDQLLPKTRLYCDGPYVVIDPIFANERKLVAADRTGPARRILVTMGGADAAGLSVKVARALLIAPEIEHVAFTCGPSFPHLAQLELTVSNAPWKHDIHVGLPNLIGLYRWCDMAIVAGGLTMYEVCCLGIPSLAVCQPIDHQFELAERLSQAGAMATVGYASQVTEAEIAAATRALCDNPEILAKMAAQGPALVDGNGASRVADILLGVARSA